MISAANPAWQPICPLWLFSILFTKGRQVFRNPFPLLRMQENSQKLYICKMPMFKTESLFGSSGIRGCQCSATPNNLSIFNVPHILSSSRARQQAVPTALPTSYHPTPNPFNFYSVFRHQLKFHFLHEVPQMPKKGSSIPQPLLLTQSNNYHPVP